MPIYKQWWDKRHYEQWQKIAIARFFYRDAPLVIFDEPTAAIDAVSEQNIFDKIYKSFKNKTVIIISHRFSTVRNADRIIVFDKGKIVEHGSHEELMAIKGKYYKAFQIQAKGYKWKIKPKTKNSQSKIRWVLLFGLLKYFGRFRLDLAPPIYLQKARWRLCAFWTHLCLLEVSTL